MGKRLNIIQPDMTNLMCQSVYSCLAGYEEVNDAQRLSVDPVMRAVTGKRKVNTISTGRAFHANISSRIR